MVNLQLHAIPSYCAHDMRFNQEHTFLNFRACFLATSSNEKPYESAQKRTKIGQNAR